MTSRSVMEFTCDYCEQKATTELDDPKNWYQLFKGGEGVGDYCSMRCVLADNHPIEYGIPLSDQGHWEL